MKVWTKLLLIVILSLMTKRHLCQKFQKLSSSSKMPIGVETFEVSGNVLVLQLAKPVLKAIFLKIMFLYKN